MTIHNTIRLLREAKQWSQEEMAERLHMSVNGYAKIERGETRLLHDKLEQIAKVFNINLSDLIAMNEAGAVFIINEAGSFNAYTHNDAHQNYYGNDVVAYKQECEHQKTINKFQEDIIKQKDELLKQKNDEIAALKEIIELLKKRHN